MFLNDFTKFRVERIFASLQATFDFLPATERKAGLSYHHTCMCDFVNRKINSICFSDRRLSIARGDKCYLAVNRWKNFDSRSIQLLDQKLSSITFATNTRSKELWKSSFKSFLLSERPVVVSLNLTATSLSSHIVAANYHVISLTNVNWPENYSTILV